MPASRRMNATSRGLSGQRYQPHPRIATSGRSRTRAAAGSAAESGSRSIARTSRSLDRLDASLRGVNRVEAILELEPEVLHEVARVHDAESRAESDEPLVSDLLSEDRAGIQQIVIVRIGRCGAGVVTGGLKLDDVENVLRNRIGEQITAITNRDRCQLRLILRRCCCRARSPARR